MESPLSSCLASTLSLKAVLNTKPMSPGIPFKDFDMSITADNFVEVSSLLVVDSSQVPQEVKDVFESLG